MYLSLLPFLYKKFTIPNYEVPYNSYHLDKARNGLDLEAAEPYALLSLKVRLFGVKLILLHQN